MNRRWLRLLPRMKGDRETNLCEVFFGIQIKGTGKLSVLIRYDNLCVFLFHIVSGCWRYSALAIGGARAFSK